MPVDLWYLPSLGHAADPDLTGAGIDGWYEGRTAGGLHFRSPVLAPVTAEAVVSKTIEAVAEARSTRNVNDVIRSVSAAASRLVDDADPVGIDASRCLESETGWSAPLVRETMEGMAATWTADALTGVVQAELEDASVLDGFAPDGHRNGRFRRAAGPPLIGLVQAGNVPGSGVTAVIRCLLVRSGVLCKLPGDEPGFTVHFMRALAATDPLLGRTVAAAWWPRDAVDPLWSSLVKCTSKVVVYGGEQAVTDLRQSLPATTDVVVYGPRTGIAVVLPDVAENDTVGDGQLAADVCAYEQQGCVSPRLVYVVGAPARSFASRLASALAVETQRLPPPPPSASEATALRALRAAAEFTAYSDAPGHGDTAVFDSGTNDFSWTVVSRETPATDMENLPRTIFVYRIESVQDLAEVLKPLRDRIQVIGYRGAADVDALAEIAVSLGVSRVAPFGSIAWPPADWRHDGRYQLVPLLRWTDLELEV
jgi:hypothetical protein